MTTDWVLWQATDITDWQWCLLASDGRVKYPVQTGSLTTAANMIGNQATILLVASEQLVLTEVTIKAKNRRQVSSALPFLLEEQLTATPDSLHFASRASANKDQYQVAIIDRQLLTDLLTEVSDHGIKLTGAFADAQALPFRANSISIVLDGNRAIIRSNNGLGFSAPITIANSLFLQLQNQHPAGEKKPEVVCYLSDKIDEPAAQLMQQLNIGPDCCQPLGQPLELLARGLEPNQTVNLLQGPFKSFIHNPQTKLPVLTLLLVSILLTLQAMSFWQTHRHLRQESAALNQQVDQTYQQHFGTAAPSSDFRKITIDQLSRLQQPGKSVPAFIDQLARILVHKPRELILTQIEYTDTSLKLLIQSPNLTTADQLRENLRAAAITNNIEITKRQNKQVSLTLTVERQ